MIRLKALAHILGLFLLILAGAMLVPLVFALVTASADLGQLARAWGITATAGVVLFRGFERPARELSLREGLLLVVLIWVAICFFGCLPFWFSPHFGSFTDAVFESVSGFTTTGATILTDVEVLEPPLQLWRCFTHWLGGMGIVLLGVAVLPLLSAGGMHLYRAEFSGARSEKLSPRVTETALSLWKIYLALTAAEFLALLIAGMGPFEAVCHAFSTLGTGGFSTRTASVGGFESPAIEYIITGFMLLAGVNFTRHYRLWVEHDPRSFFSDHELRAYGLIVSVAAVAITLSLVFQSGYPAAESIRLALFQVAAIVTTTGFATADFELWMPLPQVILLALMFGGGCTGSSAGGLKVFRMALLWKVVAREFRRLVERRGVFVVRLGDNVMPEASIQSLLNLLYLAFIAHLLGSFALAALGMDVLTSIAAVTASMFNIGPGLGTVGPAENYAHVPVAGKWVLTTCMLAGRLEFYTLIVIFTPPFWRK